MTHGTGKRCRATHCPLKLYLSLVGTPKLHCLQASPSWRHADARFPPSQFPLTHTRAALRTHRSHHPPERRRRRAHHPARRPERRAGQRHGRERHRHVRTAFGHRRQLPDQRPRRAGADGGRRAIGGGRCVLHGKAGARMRGLPDLEYRAADACPGAGHRRHRPLRRPPGLAEAPRRDTGGRKQPRQGAHRPGRWLPRHRDPRLPRHRKRPDGRHAPDRRRARRHGGEHGQHHGRVGLAPRRETDRRHRAAAHPVEPG